MRETYDFQELLTRLSELGSWLTSIGLVGPDRLRRYRQNIERMMAAQSRGEIQRLQETMPLDEAREILWSYVEGDELVRALDALRPHDDVNLRAELARALKGPPDLFLEGKNSNSGRNFAFELIVGGRFASAGYQPRYGGKADVEFDFATLHVGVQCKRILSERKLESRIGEAFRQLESGCTDLGIAAVSLSRIINPGDPGKIPEAASADVAMEYLERRVQQLAEATRRFWAGKPAQSADGLYLYAFTPIRARREGQYLPVRYDLLAPVHPGSAKGELLKCLAQTMKA